MNKTDEKIDIEEVLERIKIKIGLEFNDRLKKYGLKIPYRKIYSNFDIVKKNYNSIFATIDILKDQYNIDYEKINKEPKCKEIKHTIEDIILEIKLIKYMPVLRKQLDKIDFVAYLVED